MSHKPTRRNWTPIDHGLLSPSGRVSARARKSAIERERRRIEAVDGPLIEIAMPTPSAARKREQTMDSLRRQIETLEGLAARGMGPRKHKAAAAKLRAELEALTRSNPAVLTVLSSAIAGAAAGSAGALVTHRLTRARRNPPFITVAGVRHPIRRELGQDYHYERKPKRTPAAKTASPAERHHHAEARAVLDRAHEDRLERQYGRPVGKAPSPKPKRSRKAGAPVSQAPQEWKSAIADAWLVSFYQHPAPSVTATRLYSYMNRDDAAWDWFGTRDRSQRISAIRAAVKEGRVPGFAFTGGGHFDGRIVRTETGPAGPRLIDLEW